MIVSQALLSVMADGLFAAVNELFSTGGPEVMLGMLAIVAFVALALAAALRADLSRSAARSETALSVPLVNAAARPPGAASSGVKVVKSGACNIRKPDGRARFKPLPVQNRIYRPAYLPELSPQPRLIHARPLPAGGLSRFVERRAGVRRSAKRLAG